MQLSHIVGASRRRLACALALTLVCAGMFAAPAPALADDDQTSADSSLTELQQRVESTNATYEDAVAKQETAKQEAADNQAKLDELNAKLPEQREKASDAVRTLYKYQQQGTGLLDLVLNSENFNDLITTVQYLDVIQSSSVNDLEALAETQQQLKDTQTQLDQATAAADAEAETAQSALADAQAARDEAQAAAQAKAAAEAAAAQAAIEAAQAEAASTADGNGSLTTSTSGTASVSPTTVDTDTDKASFVSEWTGRINNYLAGSPLAGHGETFAEAAWDYGVDPRWSPAISNTESSKGLYCFKSHNAWGWGNSSWDNWDDAIRAHVSGLASGYGYTITPSAAQKYCPPTWQSWYYNTLSEMESI